MKSLTKISRRPDVIIYPSGRIDIKARVSKLLSLRDGDVIDVLSHRGECLLYVRHRRDEIVGSYNGTVHISNKFIRFCNNLRCYSPSLTNAIFAEIGAEKTSKLNLPAGEPVIIEGIGKAIPLITHNPL